MGRWWRCEAGWSGEQYLILVKVLHFFSISAFRVTCRLSCSRCCTEILSITCWILNTDAPVPGVWIAWSSTCCSSLIHGENLTLFCACHRLRLCSWVVTVAQLTGKNLQGCGNLIVCPAAERKVLYAHFNIQKIRMVTWSWHSAEWGAKQGSGACDCVG